MNGKESSLMPTLMEENLALIKAEAFIEILARFSDLKVQRWYQYSLFHLCRIQLRGNHFGNVMGLHIVNTSVCSLRVYTCITLASDGLKICLLHIVLCIYKLPAAKL